MKIFRVENLILKFILLVLRILIHTILNIIYKKL